jgi:regulator of sigma E protease
LPIGGYVRLAGATLVSREAPIAAGDFRAISRWRRIQIYAAGPAMNFLLAAALTMAAFPQVTPGWRDHETGVLVIGRVAPESAAARAGLQAGDVVVGADNFCTSSWESIAGSLAERRVGQVTLAIERDGRALDVPLPGGLGLEGAGLVQVGYRNPVAAGDGGGEPVARWRSAATIAAASLKATSSDATTIGAATGGLLIGKTSLSGLSGPIGITQAASAAAAWGWVAFVDLMALISLGIGAFNLLPLPALDGGQMALLTVEAILRRDLGERGYLVWMLAGVVVLLVLFGIATWQDVARFGSVGS